ncbi:MAG: DegV family protein [Oscillospiraceae bacterium]|nr:DegV family protein [Oscillospiraceae bacterium]
MSYDIITDSACNLPATYATKHNLGVISLKYTLGGEEFDDYTEVANSDSVKNFYARMREKVPASTSNINAATFEARFTEVLEAGRDFIYISFSSGLSSSWSFAQSTAEVLREKYPDRKIFIVDSLCVTLGLGIFVNIALKMRDEGKTIEELHEWLENNKSKVCHWFTVDDLFFLKRGGRISATTALAGTLLGIKPVMRVNEEGKLEPYAKARGRKAALTMLVDKVGEMAAYPKDLTYGISHGDCEEDAQFVADLLKERHGVKSKNIIIDHLTPLIGAHSGPGTVAFFFMGRGR